MARSGCAPAAARLGVLAGTRADLACWRTPRAPLVCAEASGADGIRARVAAERLAAERVCGLISFGLASGLAPLARPGDLVVAESVVLPSGQAVRTDDAWRESVRRALAATGPRIHVARIAARDRPLLAPADKHAAFRATFAAALDTESHAVAEIATACGLPFLVVRAIAEPVEWPRPQAALVGIGTAGEARHLAIAARLARHPTELAASWRQRHFVQTGLGAMRDVPIMFPLPELTTAHAA